MKDRISIEEYRSLTSKSRRTGRQGKYGNVLSGWYSITDVWYYFRSRAEYRFALILEHWTALGLIDGWEHEPRFFDFENTRHGVTRYMPDFASYHPGDVSVWYEVKGRFNPGDKKKIKLFEINFPELELRLIDTKWFKDNGSQYAGLPGWRTEPVAKKSLLPDDARFKEKTNRSL